MEDMSLKLTFFIDGMQCTNGREFRQWAAFKTVNMAYNMSQSRIDALSKKRQT